MSFCFWNRRINLSQKIAEMNENHRRNSHIDQLTTRREFLSRAGGGFGALALYSLLVEQGILGARSAEGAESVANPLAACPGQLPGAAKSAIFLFMDGGPSHIDTFDPKPLVNQYAG